VNAALAEETNLKTHPIEEKASDNDVK